MAAVYADSVRTYLAAERDIPRLPPDVTMTVRYLDLVNDPHATVEWVRAHFGLPDLPGDVVSVVSGWAGRRTDSSGSRFGLAEFGLDEARVRRDLAPVFDRFGGG